MSKMGSHDPFGSLKHKLWPKEGLEIKSAIWLSTTKSWESPWFPFGPHSVGKLSMRVIISLQTSFQSKVCTQCYGPPKSRESQFWEFQDSHLGVPRQNDIWVLISWLNKKYTIRGEGGGFPQVRAMVSFVNMCLPVVRPSTKMLQLCTNQLVVWFVQVRVSDWLLVILPNPILELQHAPLPPKCCESGNVPQLLLLSLSSRLDS
jgi:hypothetical protein